MFYYNVFNNIDVINFKRKLIQKHFLKKLTIDKKISMSKIKRLLIISSYIIMTNCYHRYTKSKFIFINVKFTAYIFVTAIYKLIFT